jgi:hypothetical protein
VRVRGTRSPAGADGGGAALRPAAADRHQEGVTKGFAPAALGGAGVNNEDGSSRLFR